MDKDELAAAQAYVRLLEATRAALSDPEDGTPVSAAAHLTDAGGRPRPSGAG